jgi:hypothetical protein
MRHWVEIVLSLIIILLVLVGGRPERPVQEPEQVVDGTFCPCDGWMVCCLNAWQDMDLCTAELRCLKGLADPAAVEFCHEVDGLYE